MIDDLKLDAKLLALLNQQGLLTKAEFNEINSHHLRLNIPAAGQYFVNTVMIQWSLDVFESNVRRLIDALQSHDDTGNHNLASNLCKSFSECGLDPPVLSITPLCTANS